ncbi:Alkyl hydroperoxide reductase/ Thiol specific antioxidant/ Mal allergen [Mycobacteroides abscessus]|nr:Alkyl hydroperoxide reductase/ Thiol specific antioxidant/ Mal allergen [Mycobacteroides abscessus]
MAETKRLEVGDKAPTFTLLDADGKKVSLSSYKGRKVIIYFYPAAMTPRLHQTGVRFPRQPGRTQRGRP